MNLKSAIAALAIVCATAVCSAQPLRTPGKKYFAEIGNTITLNPYLVAGGSYGTCYGNGLFLGGGAQLYFPETGRVSDTTPFKGNVVTTIFAHGKWSFCKTKVSPFVSLKLGTMWDLIPEGAFPGIFVLPEAGLDIGRLSISGGFNWNRMGYNTKMYHKADATIESFFNGRYFSYVSIGWWFK